MKCLLGFLMFSFIVVHSALAQQQSSDREMIRATVQNYFDGMMQRDRTKLDLAFVSEARLIGFRGSDFTITPYEEWAAATASGTPRSVDEYKNELISIRINGHAAVAETELYWPGIYYYDYLTLLKVNGSWKIVNKSWSSRPLK